ncbi:MAG: hypothetical protein ACPGWR_31475, partial [Ardenticatenaceae bacterium]
GELTYLTHPSTSSGFAHFYFEMGKRCPSREKGYLIAIPKHTNPLTTLTHVATLAWRTHQPTSPRKRGAHTNRLTHSVIPRTTD